MSDYSERGGKPPRTPSEQRAVEEKRRQILGIPEIPITSEEKDDGTLKIDLPLPPDRGIKQ